MQSDPLSRLNQPFHDSEGPDAYIDELLDLKEYSPEQMVFVLEAMRLLCDSLDLEDRVPKFYSFLLGHLPLRSLHFSRALPNLKMVQPIFDYDGGDCEIVRKGRYLAFDHEVFPKAIRERMQQEGLSTGLYVADKKDPVAPYLPSFEPPFFAMRMQQADMTVGSVIFCGCRRFTPSEIQKMQALRLPLRIAINNWSQYRALEELKMQLDAEMESLKRELSRKFDVSSIIGAEGGLRRQMQMATLVAERDMPVLITGETGTGKEIFARAIHAMSGRKNKSFVAVNCGGIPPSLIDSELFGHERGAFTGAATTHKGRFERAGGGTLFLDEIGELPMDVQARLLRVLQEHEVERIGGNGPIPVDFRLIAATNRDLPAMIRKGEFREDLYYRIKGFSIHIPPLREHKEDIPSLVRELLLRQSKKYGIIFPHIAKGEMAKLLDYGWPGNVRELQNVLEEALVMAENGELTFNPGGHLIEEKQGPKEEKGMDLTGTLDDVLKRYFTALLFETKNRIGGPGNAAERAGINANTLRSKLDKLGIPYKKKG